MDIIRVLLVVLVAAQHLFFLYMEMFAWETLGKKAFGGAMPKDLFAPTRNMAANQGLYNGFLAAGLLWSLVITDDLWQTYVTIFFLSCIVVAGVYGGVSVSKRIFYIQGLPAAVALLLFILKL